MHCLNFRMFFFPLKKGAITAPSSNEWKGKLMNQYLDFSFVLGRGFKSPFDIK